MQLFGLQTFLIHPDPDCHQNIFTSSSDNAPQCKISSKPVGNFLKNKWSD